MTQIKIEVLGIIPARGGSKGVHKKNIRLLAGKPLINYTIENALDSNLISRVIVSTDDIDIISTADQCGAEVVRRPLELATDTCSSELALLHTLDYLERKEKYVPDIVVFLQATSPFRKKNDIDNAIKKLLDSKSDSLFSGNISHNFHWQLKAGMLEPLDYDYMYRPMRQKLTPVYNENGSIYVFKTEVLKKYKSRLGGNIAVYEMDFINSFQIDTEEDFLFFEYLFKYISD